jgi:hypothetical protein
MKMKLNEMKAYVSGLPAEFVGMRKRWQEVEGKFEIVAAAIIQRPAVDDKGQPILYKAGDRAGEQVMDRQTVLQIRMEDGDLVLIRTNSRRVTSLFEGCISDKPPLKNRFGDDVFTCAELPEGWLRFVPYEYTYSNGKVGEICDLAEAD